MPEDLPNKATDTFTTSGPSESDHDWNGVKGLTERSTDTIVESLKPEDTQMLRTLIMNPETANTEMIWPIFEFLKEQGIKIDFDPNYGEDTDKQAANNDVFVTTLRSKLIPDKAERDIYKSQRATLLNKQRGFMGEEGTGAYTQKLKIITSGFKSRKNYPQITEELNEFNEGNDAMTISEDAVYLWVNRNRGLFEELGVTIPTASSYKDLLLDIEAIGGDEQFQQRLLRLNSQNMGKVEMVEGLKTQEDPIYTSLFVIRRYLENHPEFSKRLISSNELLTEKAKGDALAKPLVQQVIPLLERTVNDEKTLKDIITGAIGEDRDIKSEYENISRLLGYTEALDHRKNRIIEKIRRVQELIGRDKQKLNVNQIAGFYIANPMNRRTLLRVIREEYKKLGLAHATPGIKTLNKAIEEILEDLQSKFEP